MLDVTSPEYKAIIYRIEALKTLRNILKQGGTFKNKVLNEAAVEEFIAAFIENQQQTRETQDTWDKLENKT